jgi:hypothetical protein
MVKLLREFAPLLLTLLLTIPLAYGLELTASTGNAGASSSTHIVYGATVNDYANEHISLSPESGTLSNAFSGSGNLPYSSISIGDSKGNYAYASRSISGEPGVTTWNYDWNTYYPYSPTAGYGVGAWLSMDVQNAKDINAGSGAINGEGDGAVAMTQISSPTPTSALRNYYTAANAYVPFVVAYQWASSGSGENALSVGWSGNQQLRGTLIWRLHLLAQSQAKILHMHMKVQQAHMATTTPKCFPKLKIRRWQMNIFLGVTGQLNKFPHPMGKQTSWFKPMH